MMMKVMGIFSIVVGIGVVVATAAGGLFPTMQWKGYLYGSLIAVFGVIRFFRGMNR